MTSAGIEPATYRFVVQNLNHYATLVPTVYVYTATVTEVIPTYQLTAMFSHNTT